MWLIARISHQIRCAGAVAFISNERIGACVLCRKIIFVFIKLIFLLAICYFFIYLNKWQLEQSSRNITNYPKSKVIKVENKILTVCMWYASIQSDYMTKKRGLKVMFVFLSPAIYRTIYELTLSSLNTFILIVLSCVDRWRYNSSSNIR